MHFENLKGKCNIQGTILHYTQIILYIPKFWKYPIKNDDSLGVYNLFLYEPLEEFLEPTKAVRFYYHQLISYVKSISVDYK